MTTFATLITRYATDIAEFIGQHPARDAEQFLDAVYDAQDISDSSPVFSDAADAFNTAYTLLTDAQAAGSGEQAVLLDKADSHLGDALAWI